MFQYLLLLRMVADLIRVFTRNCNLTLDSTFTSTICVSVPVATSDGCRPEYVYTRNCNLTLDSTFTSTLCVSVPVAVLY